MRLVHPAHFAENIIVSASELRGLINEVSELYPFAVSYAIALENNNVHVLYNNTEISVLLGQLVHGRDALIAKKKERKQYGQENRVELEDRAHSEDIDLFEGGGDGIDEEYVKEAIPNLQDFMSVIKTAKLEEALPEAMKLIELAVTTLLRSVHCKRVFSRMKRVVPPLRSNTTQKRKEMLVFLQVKHKLLRALSNKKLQRKDCK